MYNHHFKEYSLCAGNFDYNKVPYMKVAALKFTRDNSKVYYKTSLTEKEYTMANIIKKRNSQSLNVSGVFPVPKMRKDYKTVSVQKKRSN